MKKLSYPEDRAPGKRLGRPCMWYDAMGQHYMTSRKKATLDQFENARYEENVIFLGQTSIHLLSLFAVQLFIRIACLPILSTLHTVKYVLPEASLCNPNLQ